MFPLLDGYRAVAALMVLTTHVAFTTAEIFTPVTGPLLGRMDFGVTLFFLLSGFLLYRPRALAAMTDSPGPRLSTYALRRSARILPAYWVMVAVTLLVLPEIQPVSPSTWAINLGLLHIYLPGFTLEGLTQTWSLATEVSFYALLPVIAWWAGRRHRGDVDRSTRRQLLALATLVGLAWIYTLVRLSTGVLDAPLAGLWLPGFLDWFALGMAAAVVSARLSLGGAPAWMQRFQDLARDTPTCLVIAAALYVIVATPLGGPLTLTPAGTFETATKHALYGLIALVFLLPGFLGRWGNTRTVAGTTVSGTTTAVTTEPSVGSDPEFSRWALLLRNPVVVYLGTISYGIFLWHQMLIRLIVDVTDLPVFAGGFLPLWAATVGLSVAAATISWFLIERPLQRWAHRGGRRRPRASLPQPVPAP